MAPFSKKSASTSTPTRLVRAGSTNPPRSAKPHPNEQSRFLRLPAELRNIIYHYVFYPTVTPDCLIPSATDLSRLSFLYTCRQVHAEAQTLAHGVLFSVTNRRHPDDLAAMHARIAARPAHGVDDPLRTLEFAAQWRQAHQPPAGDRLFLDTFPDYARFVWDVLRIFGAVECLVICAHRDPDMFAQRLGYVLDLEATGRCAPDRGWHTEAPLWVVEATSSSPEFKLVGRGIRAGRTVTVCSKMVEDDRIVQGGNGALLTEGMRLSYVPKSQAAALQDLLDRLR